MTRGKPHDSTGPSEYAHCCPKDAAFVTTMTHDEIKKRTTGDGCAIMWPFHTEQRRKLLIATRRHSNVPPRPFRGAQTVPLPLSRGSSGCTGGVPGCRPGADSLVDGYFSHGEPSVPGFPTRNQPLPVLRRKSPLRRRARSCSVSPRSLNRFEGSVV